MPNNNIPTRKRIEQKCAKLYKFWENNGQNMHWPKAHFMEGAETVIKEMLNPEEFKQWKNKNEK